MPKEKERKKHKKEMKKLLQEVDRAPGSLSSLASEKRGSVSVGSLGPVGSVTPKGKGGGSLDVIQPISNKLDRPALPMKVPTLKGTFVVLW